MTEQVRRRPYSVVLFDELEKAHTEIWSILLQIMEDGILTDSKGRGVDFRNTVVILTSNASAERLSKGEMRLGFLSSPPNTEKSKTPSRSFIMAELQKTFRPEFLNRLDELVVFEALAQKEMESIAEKMLLQLSTRMQALGVELTYDPEVLTHLATQGLDPVYGARPLRRLMQTEIESPAAQLLLSNVLSAGQSIHLRIQNEALTLEQETTV